MYVYIYFFLHSATGGILVSPLEIEPMPPALEVWNLNPWTAREVTIIVLLIVTFHTVHGVLKAGIQSGLPFPSPVDHILSDLSTMTRPSWVAPRALLSFIELDKAVVLV